MTVYVDGAGLLRTWINGQTATLVGLGKPLQLGASLNQRTGGAGACYAYLVELPAFLWAGHETPDMAQRISAQIYGPTKEAAAQAAIAYCEALMPMLAGIASAVPGATIRTVDNITGPQWLPDGDEARYIVDADFYFAA